MLRHYLRISWRNLLRNRSFTFINIGGLAIGMTVALLIGLWIFSEYQFDKEFKNYDSIVQVMRQDTIEGNIEVSSAIPIPLVKLLKNKYNQYFKHIIIGSLDEDHILSYHNKPLAISGMYMDEGVEDMLSLKMIYGNYDNFSDPESILISQSASKAFFGNRNPIGQNLMIDNEYPVEVAGVYEDFKKDNSFNGKNFIATWNQFLKSNNWAKEAEDDWGNNSFQLFAELAGNQSSQYDKVITQIIQNGFGKENIPNLRAAHSTFRLLPMRDWHLRNRFENGVQDGGLITQIRLYSFIGMLVLLIACINFMNLYTARSERKSKEVGIRKALGSIRNQLILQFYFETLLISVIASIIAMIIVCMGLQWFNNFYETVVIIPWHNLLFWGSFLLFILITTLFAGSYPAFYLSSINAIVALKGKFRVGKNTVNSRKVLIVGQFSISLILIIATCVIYGQIKFAEKRNPGYNKDQLITIRMKSKDFYGKYDLIRNELLKKRSIIEMSESSSPMTEVWTYNDAFDWEGKDPRLAQRYGTVWVTPNYGKTVNWKIIDGRDFSNKGLSDSTSIILNEAAVKYMGLKDPIGKRIKWGDGPEAKFYEVIGVVKNLITQSPYHAALQTVYFWDNEQNCNWMILKLNNWKGGQEAISNIESVFKKYIPEAPFAYNFVDQNYKQKFASEDRVGTLAALFATLAIFICFIGLFGLASFMAEQRIKEIGIRKVLGASVVQLWLMLSKNFIYLVIISIVISIPFGWYIMNLWLQNYNYRIPINGWLLVLPALLSLIIALLTVSWHTIRAAKVNPVKSIETE
ncbi:ABC-type antimicrobial peptide transport system, permease component [Arachidicoccus rhizosphaerae]|uniref:ABC-type antimicrobial peptide transport system, permease component n=1 Tax=Arachidicoccus rhizosphaerae TaxID=551991 RepID=A0A1H3W8J7_9BACT|nr:FtsX-like permease family protein [Arachidicoccus rhizosphaerae]SDZ82608.1 ABC-type antimicrobial peptide transport system, permease component [Arachidicoccus rhizosphaerae]